MLQPMYHLTEFLRQDNTVTLIAVTADFRIWESADDGANWSEITGALAGVLSTLDLQFANLNGELYVGAFGHRIHRFTDALGSFVEVPDSPVSRGSLISTFGRLWAAVDAESIVSYSGLLDGTDWTSVSAGSIDASNAWTNGYDNVEALASFGATLLIFGTEHILLYVDGAGSELGVDPDNLYVVDTVEGTGCTNRDSIITIGEGDLWYLGPQGVQSLQRVISEKVNPLVDISKNQRSLVERYRQQHVGNPASVKAIYSPENRFVLFLFPEADSVLMYDTRFPLEDGTWRATTWSTRVPYTGALARRNGDVLFGLNEGNVGIYDRFRDDQGGADDIIVATYASPYLNFGQEAHNKIKNLKEFYIEVDGSGQIDGLARWGVDFRPLEYSQPWVSNFVQSFSEFNIAEFGNDNFNSGLRLRREYIAAMGEGKTVQFFTQFQSTNDDALVSIAEIGVHAKIGRSL